MEGAGIQDKGSFIDTLFWDIVDARQLTDTEHYNNYASLYGNQWASWNESGRRYINYLSVVKDDRVRVTVNKIRPIMAARTAFIIGSNPAISIDSTSPETEDKLAAYTAQRVARAHWEEVDLWDKICRTWEWTKSCGLSFVKTYFNPNAGKYLGKTEKGKNVFEGKVQYKIPSPFGVVWDPMATIWDEVRWVTIANIYSREEVEEMGFEFEYGELDAAVKGTAPTQLAEMLMDLNNPELVDTRQYRDQKGRQRNILVMEHFKRPCQEYPLGYYAVVINKKIKKEDVLEVGEIPITPFFDSTEAGIVNAQTPVSELRPLQEMLNRVISLDWERSQQPDIYAFPFGGGWPKKFHSRALITGQYDPRMGAPQFVPGGQVRQDYVMKMRYFEEQMENIAGISSIASRARPPYEMSGRMGYIVNEANRSLLSDVSTRFARSVQDLTRLSLKFIDKYYNEDRLMSYINEFDRREVVRYKQKSIGSNWAVRVTLNTNNDNPQARSQRLLLLSQNQPIMQVLMSNPVTFKKYLSGVDAELGNDIYTNETDFDVAQDENFEISQGGMPQVMPWHEDDKHNMEHKRALDSDDARAWPPQCFQALVQHYYMHEQQKSAKMRKMAFEQGQAKQLGGETEGTEEAPPGVGSQPAGPETPIEAIDQNLETQTEGQYPTQPQGG